MEHQHGSFHADAGNVRVLRTALLITAAFMLIEAAVGVVSGSLALLSDAGHMLSDAAALGLALLAFKLGERPADTARSYGYQRVEILAAALNGLTLVAIAVWIVAEAVQRLLAPPRVVGWLMLCTALLGLLVNLLVMALMKREADTEGNINMRGAYLHVLGDLLGSAGAIIAGIVMLAFGWYWADPLISLLIAALIAKSGWHVLRDSIHVLMEGTPPQVDLATIVSEIRQIDGVLDVHDLHAWTITSRSHALSCHIAVSGGLTVEQAAKINALVQAAVQKHGIGHVTIQTEPLSGCLKTDCLT